MLSNTDKSTSGSDVLSGPAQQDRSALESTSLGTESSNTVPSTSISQLPTHVLRAAIDSLYLTFQGDLRESSNVRLKELKELAQSTLQSDSSLAQYEINSHIFEVKGNGRNPYAFILVDANYRIEIAKIDAAFVPMAYCKISSELLTMVGSDRAVSELQAIISELGIIEGPPSVSRADLCVDFTTEVPLNTLDEKEFVTKARSNDRHVVTRQFSGFSFGVGSPFSARLYDKTLQMICKNHPRPDLERLWSAAGWSGNETVWRLEFQLRREALRGFCVVSYSDLVESLFGLWQYSTFDWLRHTIRSPADKTQSRWPTSPFWKTLQEAHWENATRQKLARVDVERGRIPSDRHLFINGLASLTSFCAREGLNQAETALEVFINAARSYHDTRSKETGIDFDNYFRQKIENKRKSYNVAVNSPLDDKLHPADVAVTNNLRQRAREYRKAKDGE